MKQKKKKEQLCKSYKKNDEVIVAISHAKIIRTVVKILHIKDDKRLGV